MRLAKVAALHAGRLPPEESAAWQEHQHTQMLKLDLLLDEGQGECILRTSDQRFIVAEALLHFEGNRCQMQSYAIMPNHVHVLCRPLAGYTLEDLCGSWKWFTSQRIQQDLGRKGPLWQSENFDRIIRDAEHFARTVRYIAKNPVKARLREDEATVWFNDAIRHGNRWS